MYAGPRPKPLPSVSQQRDLDPPAHLQAGWREEDWELQAFEERWELAEFGTVFRADEERVEREWTAMQGEDTAHYDLEGRVF